MALELKTNEKNPVPTAGSYRFLYLIWLFSYLRKNMETRRKREDLFRPFLRDLVFFRIEPVFIPYLINMGRT
jgi:hypothetical protein